MATAEVDTLNEDALKEKPVTLPARSKVRALATFRSMFTTEAAALTFSAGLKLIVICWLNVLSSSFVGTPAPFRNTTSGSATVKVALV